MKREEVTEKILDAKREKSLTWKEICAAIGGNSPIIITAALHGQMKLTPEQAGKAKELFGLTEMEARMLTEIRDRCRPFRRPIR
jgi:cyanate lyase